MNIPSPSDLWSELRSRTTPECLSQFVHPFADHGQSVDRTYVSIQEWLQCGEPGELHAFPYLADIFERVVYTWGEQIDFLAGSEMNLSIVSLGTNAEVVHVSGPYRLWFLSAACLVQNLNGLSGELGAACQIYFMRQFSRVPRSPDTAKPLFDPELMAAACDSLVQLMTYRRLLVASRERWNGRFGAELRIDESANNDIRRFFEWLSHQAAFQHLVDPE
ncbi:MAG: hypothetical protein AMXMBFR58_35610 [Phycisphaerae bacterium]